MLALVLLCRNGICGEAVNPKSGASIISPPPISTDAYDWLKHPPAWVTWLSLFGGVGTFGWKLYEFMVSRADRGTDQRIACDAFWYESIVVPRIVEPLLDFLTSQNEKLNSLAASSASAKAEFEAFNQEFQAGYGRLAARIRVLQVISVAVHGEIMERLDGLEDAVTVYCYEAGQGNASKSSRRGSVNLTAHFSGALGDCLTKFKDLHFHLRHPSR